MKLSDLGERSIIREINNRFMKGTPMNDCATIESGDEFILVSTDLASTSTNIPDGAKPRLIGEFAASINLSDIAAMAGVPVGMMVSLAVKPDTDDEFLFSVMEGIQRKLRAYDADILGGDTKEGKDLSITGTVLGRQKKSRTLMRSNIREGQVLCVTGNLGRAASGYVFYRSGYSVARGIDMIMNLVPRIREAQIIAEHGGKFMTDISDGLFSSLTQMKKDLGIGAKLVQDEVPVNPNVKKASEISGATELDITAGFGGDYELLFTIDNSRYSEFSEAMRSEGVPVSFIGETWSGKNIIFNGENWKPMVSGGYEHFRKIPELGTI